MDDFFAPSAEKKYTVNPRLGKHAHTDAAGGARGSLATNALSRAIGEKRGGGEVFLACAPCLRWVVCPPRAEYKTVKAVNGPLVILEDVKVSFEGVRLCLSGVCARCR
jgi:hypothetical protein